MFDLNKIGKREYSLPPILLLYGVEGIGKSTLGASTKKHIYVCCEEPGPIEGTFYHFQSDSPVAGDISEVTALLDGLLREEHPYKILVLDSVSSLERLIHKEVCRKAEKKSIDEIGYGKGYTFAHSLWMDLMRQIQSLRDYKKMAVLLLGHAQVVTFQDPMRESYDQYQPRLHKSVSPEIRQIVDAVLFANYQTSISKEKEGGIRERNIGKGAGIRVIYTEDRPSHLAKNRYNMPPQIEFGWLPIMQSIQEFNKQETGTKQESNNG